MPIIHSAEREIIPVIQNYFLIPTVWEIHRELQGLTTILGPENTALYIARLSFLETNTFEWRAEYHNRYSPTIVIFHHFDAMGSHIENDELLLTAYAQMCRYMVFHDCIATPINDIRRESLVRSMANYTTTNFDTHNPDNTLDIRLLFGPIVTLPSTPPSGVGEGTIRRAMRGFTVEATTPNLDRVIGTSPQTRVDPLELAIRFTSPRDGIDLATIPHDGPPSLRPTSHSANDIAHNLNIKYRGCFGVLNGDLFVIREFSTGQNKSVDIHFYKDEGRDKITKQTFDPNTHKFVDLDYGWVQAKNRLVYLETVIGGYVRGVSDSNVMSSVSIVDNSIVLGERVKSDMVIGLMNRKFIDVETGLRDNSEGIIISREIALFLAKDKSKKHSKYFLMYSDMCVGELSKNTRFIKIYTPYKGCISALTKVMPYDLR